MATKHKRSSWGEAQDSSSVFRNDPNYSVKETRKLLGKAYGIFSDDEILEIATLTDVVARDFIQTASEGSKIREYYLK